MFPLFLAPPASSNSSKPMPQTPLARKRKLETLRNQIPPEGQLCENNCGQTARFHLLRTIRTATGTIVRWYWCCSNHYRKCPTGCKAAEEKKRKTSLERYGVEHPMRNPQTIQKRDRTEMERYGVTNVMHLQEFVDRRQRSIILHNGSLRCGYETRLARFREATGLSHWNSIPGQGQRVQAAIRLRFGTHYSKNAEWRSERLERTGYEHPRADPAVEMKRTRTCLGRYGAPYRIKRFEPFVFPSGRTVLVREPRVLQRLLARGVVESDIAVGADCPIFVYEGGRYVPDVLVRSEKLIIQVGRKKNLAIATAILNAGYRFEFHTPKRKRLPNPLRRGRFVHMDATLWSRQ